jgi:hypothetical protein
MMGFFTPRKKLPQYAVTLELNGNHGYRTEPEFQVEDGTATVHVRARSWNDAYKQATKPDVLGKLKFWTARVVRIERDH